MFDLGVDRMIIVRITTYDTIVFRMMSDNFKWGSQAWQVVTLPHSSDFEDVI